MLRENNTDSESVQHVTPIWSGGSPTEQRLSAFRNGFRPLPVTNIHARVKSPGKQPILPDWQNVAAAADEETIRAWSDKCPDCTNTGLLTGAKGRIVAFDIDVLIQKVAEEIADLAREMLGVTPLTRIGLAPKSLLVYRAGEDFGKLQTEEYRMPDGSKAQLEILSTGQQFVAFGIHPNTRQPYRWVDGDPSTVAVEDLPEISREEAELLVEMAAKIFRDAGGVPMPRKPKESKERSSSGPSSPHVGKAKVGDNYFRNVNNAALADREPWVKAIFGNKARHQPGTDAWRVRPEDLGRNLEEDLSIHPNGVTDWGEEESLTPIDTAIKFGGKRDATTAAHWLCETLGIDPVTLGWSELSARRESPEEPAPGGAEGSETDDEPVVATSQPFDLFGDHNLTGIPQMPRGCVPDVIEAFARDESERLGIDPAMIATGCVVAAATVIDPAWKIQPKMHDHTWVENARAWVAFVAPPSAKKSPALEAVTNPLKRLDQEYAEADEEIHRQHEIEMKIYAKKLEAYALARAKNEDVPQPLEPIQPPKRRVMVKDVNVATLTDVLKDNPDGVICTRDELAAWFATFDNRDTGAKERADWLSCYNGGSHTVDRIKRGSIRIPNWSANLLGTIQPERMREIVSTMSDDGMMQRFMLIHADAAGRGVDRPPNEAAIARYHSLIRTLKGLRGGAKEPAIRMSEEAQACRTTLLDITDVIMALPDSPTALRYHMGKWDGLFARLCLTFHMVECASDGAFPDDIVSGETAHRVLIFMRDLLLPNLMKFYREMYSVSPNLELARWIAGYIIANAKTKVSQRDVYRSYSSNLRDKPQLINDAMRLLDLANWVDPVESRNGRDVTEWKVNPLVHSVFAQRAAEEKARRDTVKATIAKAAKLGIALKSAA